MAGIERFERKVGIEAGSRSVDFSAPRVADIGQEMRGLGRSITSFADPILRDKAQKQGLADAGKQPIVRDEQGRLTRAEPLPGGGLAYREAFTKAASQLYRGRLLEESEIAFENIRRETQDDPQAMFARMDAHRQVVLETTPPDMRAEIENDLSRELMQRFNGAAAAKADRDRKTLSRELGNQFDAFLSKGIADIAALSDLGDWAAVDERANQLEAELQRNQDARAQIGDLGEVGEQAEDLGVESRIVPIAAEVASVRGMQGIIGRASEFAGDRSSLEMLAQWVDADPTGGKGKLAIGMSRDDYVKLVPSARVRQSVANWANGALSDLNRLEAAQAQGQRDAAEAARTQTLIDAFTGGTHAAGDEPLVQKAIDKETDEMIRANGGNVTQWMLYGDGKDPNAGVKHLTAVVEQYGFLPTNYRAFLETQIDGTNGGRVAEVLLNMQTMRGAQGQRPGLKILRSLPAHVRAKADYLRELVEGGIGMETAQTLLEKREFKQLPIGKVPEYFPDEDGRPSIKAYREARDASLKGVFPTLSTVQTKRLSDRIDSLMPSYLAMYGEKGATKALDAATRAIATVWAPHPVGLDGVLPAELVGLNLTLNELDIATGNYVGGAGAARGGFPHGGAFSLAIKTGPMKGQPRARIEIANDDTPIAAGLGYYRIWYYDEGGNKVGPPRTVALDQGVKQVTKFKGDWDRKLREAQVAGARKDRARDRAVISRQNAISDRGPKY